MDNLLSYVWLLLACGVANPVYSTLFERYSDITEIYKCEDYAFLGDNLKCLSALKDKNLSKAYGIAQQVTKNGISYCCYQQPSYPKKLKSIKNPPPILFYYGDIKPLNTMPFAAIVGTRKNSEYGGNAAEEFAYKISKCKIGIVSGLAKGIDARAHIGALRSDGYTVGVLGTPINEIYPKENVLLFASLKKQGAIISERYPGCPSTKADFPNRNRIISALSDAVLIAEAGEKSGALITAQYGVKQGKRVFGIPGPLGSSSAGVNRLLQKGAGIALEPWDVIREIACEYPNDVDTEQYNFTPLSYSYGNKISDMPVIPQPTVKPPVEQKDPMLSALTQKPLTADELVQILKIPVTEVLSKLTELEIEGKINACAGGTFVLTE